MAIPAMYELTKTGVWNLDEFLAKGEVSPVFYSRLGIGVHILQAFIDGDVQPGIMPLFPGVPVDQIEEVRNLLGRQGAIGFILAVCITPPGGR